MNRRFVAFVMLFIFLTFSLFLVPVHQAHASPVAVAWALSHLPEIIAFLVAAGASFASYDAAKNAAVDFAVRASDDGYSVSDIIRAQQVGPKIAAQLGISILTEQAKGLFGLAKSYISGVWDAITNAGTYSSSYSMPSESQVIDVSQSYDGTIYVPDLSSYSYSDKFVFVYFWDGNTRYPALTGYSFSGDYRITPVKYNGTSTSYTYSVFSSMYISISRNSLGEVGITFTPSGFSSRYSFISGPSGCASMSLVIDGQVFPPVDVPVELDSGDVAIDDGILSTPADTIGEVDNVYTGKAIAVPTAVDDAGALYVPEASVAVPDLVGSTADDVLVDSQTGTTVGTGDLDLTLPADGTLNFNPLLKAFDGLTGRFPFSLPWDIQHIMNYFSFAQTGAPSFQLSIPFLGMQNSFNVDFSMFDYVADIVRILEVISFDVLLIFLAFKWVGGGS